MSDLVIYDGRQIPSVNVGDERYVALKPIVEGMGLDWKRQLRKITGDKRWCHMDTPFETAGGLQRMVAIPLRKLNGWLFSVNATKCRPEIREKVLRYQEECFQVLHDYFQRGGAINPKATVEELGLLIGTIKQQAQQLALKELENRQLRTAVNVLEPRSNYGRISRDTKMPMIFFRRAYWRSSRSKTAERDGVGVQILLNFPESSGGREHGA